MADMVTSRRNFKNTSLLTAEGMTVYENKSKQFCQCCKQIEIPKSGDISFSIVLMSHITRNTDIHMTHEAMLWTDHNNRDQYV